MSPIQSDSSLMEYRRETLDAIMRDLVKNPESKKEWTWEANQLKKIRAEILRRETETYNDNELPQNNPRQTHPQIQPL